MLKLNLSILDLRKNCGSPGFDSGEEKLVLSERGEAIASLKEEKLIFTGRAEAGDCKALRKSSITPKIGHVIIKLNVRTN